MALEYRALHNVHRAVQTKTIWESPTWGYLLFVCHAYATFYESGGITSEGIMSKRILPNRAFPENFTKIRL